MKILFVINCLIITISGRAQDVTGRWKTIDDETGKQRSIVEITERNGKIYGSIFQLFVEEDEEKDPVCGICPGDRKNQKILGMEIIRGMELDKSSGEYENGEILDPESGSVYNSKLWVDEKGHLNVRGYIMFLYRTQIWLPVNE